MKRRESERTTSGASKHQASERSVSSVAATRSSLNHTAFALPLDVLEAIVTFIPHYPRILVLSLVSKRWRTAVLRSITCLPSQFSPSCADTFMLAVPLFPLISSLRALRFPDDFVLPAKLQAITIGYHYCAGWACSTSPFVTATGITDLSLHLSCRLASALALNCRTSLAKLHLDERGQFGTGDGRFPFFDYFPVLKALDVRTAHDMHESPRLQFLIRHSSQLTDLSVGHLWGSSLHFPSLQVYKHMGSGLQAESCLPVCPNIHLTGLLPELIRRISPPPSSLVALELCEVAPALEDLRPYSRLLKLEVCLSNGPNDGDHQAFGSMVASLPTLPCGASLQEISFHGSFGRRPLINVGHLPNLRKLSSVFPVLLVANTLPRLSDVTHTLPVLTSFAEFIAHWEALIAAAPSIRRLELGFTNSPSFFIVAKVLLFLRLCAANGVESVALPKQLLVPRAELAEFSWMQVMWQKQ